MKVTQIYDIMNNVTEEVLGKSNLISEDLTGIVDVGKEIINQDSVDNYVKKLVNHIGKVVFKNKVYSGSAPSVLMDAWEYGSILEKVSAELPKANENESYELEDGRDYSPDVFYQPKVSVKFFNSKTTFEIPLSFTEIQVKESFSSAEQLNGFLTMLTTSIENSMTVKLDGLIMRTINNMIGDTLLNDKDGVKAVNLLAGYNETYGETETVQSAMKNPNFIRYANYIIGLYYDRIQKISTLFNIGGKERFTNKEDIVTVLLSDFEKSSSIFMKSDLNNDQYVDLPQHETIPYWQASGKLYAFDDVSKIDVKTSSNKKLTQTGILGVMFDREALGVANLDRRVTTNYNPKAEFYTNFYKFDAGFFNDMNENFIVFYLEEPEPETPEEPEEPAGQTK